MIFGRPCPSTNVGAGGKLSDKLLPAGPQFQIGVRAGSQALEEILGLAVARFTSELVERFELVLSRQASQGKQGCQGDRPSKCKA